jgi:hypothetical protein
LLRPRQGKPEDGTFDLFLRRAPDDAPGKALFIRGSVTLPNEEINFRNRKAFAALVAPGQSVPARCREPGAHELEWQCRKADTQLARCRK